MTKTQVTAPNKTTGAAVPPRHTVTREPRARTARSGRTPQARAATRAATAAALAASLAPALAPAPAHPQAPPAPVDADARHSIDQVFAEYDRTGGPGCALGVVRNGELTYARGYGIGQMDHGIPIDERSVFYLASVSKQFAAAAVVIAAHEGHLSLNDDIRTHLPEFPGYAQGTVRVRDLVHHTSGIRDYLTLMSLAGTPLENVLTDEAMLDLITRQKELNFVPGAEHLYSNSGYILMGEIVERATGRSLREYAHEKIFRPLGMASTHFRDDHTEVVRGRVFSYHPRPEPDPGEDGAPGPGPAAAPRPNPGFPEAAWRTDYLIHFDKVGDGGLYSSVEDLARWDAAFYSDVLGVPDFAARMYERGVLAGGDTIPYAHGLSVAPRRGLMRVSHAGGLMAFRTMIARYPDQRTTVITLCNVGTANPVALSMAVEDIVLAGAFPESAAQAARTGAAAEAGPAAAGQAEAAPQPPAEQLAAVAGSYHSDEIGATWRVEAEDGRLMLHHPSGESHEMQHRGADTFGRGGIEMAFVRDGGSVTAFVLTAGRVRNVRFERASRPS